MTGFILLAYEPTRISTFRGITTFELEVHGNQLIFTHKTGESFAQMSEEEKWDFFETLADEMCMVEEDSRKNWIEDALIIET